MPQAHSPASAYHIVLDEADYDTDSYTFRVTQDDNADGTSNDLDILVDLDSAALHNLSSGVHLATWGRVAYKFEHFKDKLATVVDELTDAQVPPGGAELAKSVKAESVPAKPKGKSTSVLETTTAPAKAKTTPATPTERKGK